MMENLLSYKSNRYAEMVVNNVEAAKGHLVDEVEE
jgi:hypothetical protein